MKLFGKGYEVTLNRVHDNITIRESGETLKLSVNGDAMRMVAGLNRAQQKMKDSCQYCKGCRIEFAG